MSRDTKVVKLYVHDDPDEGYFEDFGPDGYIPCDKLPWDEDDPRWDAFGKPAYEVQLDVEVDVETGQNRIIGIGGVKLETLPEFR